MTHPLRGFAGTAGVADHLGDAGAASTGETSGSDSYIGIVSELLAAAEKEEEITLSATYQIVAPEGSAKFIYVFVAGSSIPQQGWKLHLPANDATAPAVLAATVPVLASHQTTFKIVASAVLLSELNHGEGGVSQVGKFLTAYPRSNAEAVELAEALEVATAGMAGPNIPSDRALNSGGLVHYRYGSFGGRYMQTLIGETVPAIATANGSLTPDRRESYYVQPDWVRDPFPTGNVPSDTRPRIGRFQLVAEVERSSHNSVWLAIDTSALDVCVIKRPLRHVCTGAQSPDRRNSTEAAILRHLKELSEPPQLIEVATDADGAPCLVLEAIEGKRLDVLVGETARAGSALNAETVLDLAMKLADAVSRVHDAGTVHADLKSANIMVGTDGSVRLLDWDAAATMGDKAIAGGRGTVGYASPQRLRGEPATISDDVYSLGALMFFLATGAEPGLRPLGALVPCADGRLLRDDLPSSFDDVVAACVDPAPARRPADTDDVRTRLRIVARTPAEPAEAQRSAELPSAMARAQDLDEWRDIALDLAADLTSAMSSEEATAPWLSVAADGSLQALRDVNAGVAGIALALCDVVESVGGGNETEKVTAAVARSARWLAHTPLSRLPGLFVGDMGVCVALLRCAQVLDDASLLSSAHERALVVAQQPFVSPDLFNGTAGRLRGHLALWQATGDDRHIRAATACGDDLVRLATRDSTGHALWTIPPGYGGLSGCSYFGYAHGCSGIADALLSLYTVTGSPRWLDAIVDAAEGLAAARSVPDGSAQSSTANWPQMPGAPPQVPLWCHGATGVGLFYMHLSRVGVYSQAEPLAADAIRAVSAARWVGPLLCHGLAGNILALIEARRTGILGEGSYPEAALARSLHAYIGSSPPYHLTLTGPDLMTGRAGLIPAGLALAGHWPGSYALLMGSPSNL